LKQHVEKTTETENYGSGFVIMVGCSSLKYTFSEVLQKEKQDNCFRKRKENEGPLATRTLLVDPI
jgi:hypothetical protein